MSIDMSDIQTAQSTHAGHHDCHAVGQILDRIGDKWTIMVVGVLADGKLRFNEIMRRIDGISHRMLTLTLRGLERDGLVTRTAFTTIPPRVDYELTELGRSLIEPLRYLAQWSVEHRTAMERAQRKFDARIADVD